jgi:hypothetical protein
MRILDPLLGTWKGALQSLLRVIRISATRGLDEDNLLSIISLLRPYSVGYELIRMGESKDGGYLLPDDLIGIDGCFSPGVSNIVSFEEELLRRGIPCFLADNSVSFSPIEHNLIRFDKKHVTGFDSENTFTLSTWLSQYEKESTNLILQMDIEGAEYEVILATSQEKLKQFRIMVIEFHNLEHLPDNIVGPIIVGALKKVLNDFFVVHIHPNNARKLSRWGKLLIPPTLEVTFLRKDRVSQYRPVENLPHSLDADNVSHNDSIILPSYWWKN